MRIYMIRHGRTSWNDLGKWQGTTDIPLDDTGISQAHAIGKRLKKQRLSTIYTSDLCRAKTTADIISKYNGVAVVAMPVLREVNLGDWEGKTIIEIQELDSYLSWEENAEIAPHGGESFRQVHDRVVGAVNMIAEKENGDVAIVSHGASIRLFICYVLGMPLSERLRFTIDNASLITIHYNKEKKRYTLVTLNDKSHLEN